MLSGTCLNAFVYIKFYCLEIDDEYFFMLVLPDAIQLSNLWLMLTVQKWKILLYF